MLCISDTMPWQDVRLSHAGIVWKRLNASSNLFTVGYSHTILVFPYQTLWQYSDGEAPNRGIECKECEKSRFSTIMLLTYLVDEHSALCQHRSPADTYLFSNFPPSATELFRLPPHRSGTHYQKQSFWHQHCGRSSTNWKLSCLNNPSFIALY